MSERLSTPGSNAISQTMCSWSDTREARPRELLHKARIATSHARLCTAARYLWNPFVLSEITSSPTPQAKLAQVLVLAPSKALELLSYTVPDSLAAALRPGQRVVVPLRSRRVTGLVMGFEENGDRNLSLKPIAELLDPGPVLDAAHIELLRFSARYYMASLTEVCRAIIPSALRAETKTVYKATRVPNPLESAALNHAEHQVLAALSKRALSLSQLQRITEGSTRTLAKLESLGLIVSAASSRGAHRSAFPRYVRVTPAVAGYAARGAHQRRILEILREASGKGIAAAELAASHPQGKSAIRALIKRGVLEVVDSDRSSNPVNSAESTGFELSADQEAALAAITPAIEQARSQAFLLWGVTGSGKTEI
jgi:primosomal protein N' (replication factor Y)